ncbi:MAG: hypothetical protein ACJAZV_000152 [Roseivirga sp.]|jgi:hypothetical protein
MAMNNSDSVGTKNGELTMAGEEGKENFVL